MPIFKFSFHASHNITQKDPGKQHFPKSKDPYGIKEP